MDDAEQATDGAQTESFKIKADGLLMDGDAMPLFFRRGSKGAMADETAKALRSSAIVAPFPDVGSGPAVRAERCIHRKEYRLSPPL